MAPAPQDCPEIFAWGFRNPWRWSFDRQGGQLWLGDVGSHTREEVDRVVRGGNYGWRCFEGTLQTALNCGTPTTPLLPPVAEYDAPDRAVGASGGFVYHGTAIPALVGRYVFADYNLGIIWNIATDTAPTRTMMAADGWDSGLNPASFAQDNDGELFIVDVRTASIYKLVQAVTRSSPAPRRSARAASRRAARPCRPTGCRPGCVILPVAGITQVTAGCASTNFRNTCAQLFAPNSAAHAGSGLPCTRVNRLPSSNARLMSTATPLSAHSGNSRFSASRVRHRIVELHEVELLALDDVDEIGIGAGGVVRDADVLDLALGLPAPQRLQVRVEIDEVVHLHELDALVLEQRHRALHLLDALLFAVPARTRRPHLRGDEGLRLLLRRQQIAEHRFGGGIHGRGVDERGAAGEKALQHFAQRRARRLVGADFERPRGAEPDGRNRFARRGNAPHQQLAGGTACRPAHASGPRRRHARR